MAKVLPPIVVNGIRYRVLRLDGGKYGRPRFILRNDDGDLFAVYGRNAQSAMSAAPLVIRPTSDNALRGVDFTETEDGRLVFSG